MKRVVFFFLIISLVTIDIFSQNDFQTENESHIFWQKDRILTQDDFKGSDPRDPKLISYCDTMGMCSMAYVGLFSVLDVPKKRSQYGKLMEIVYFAPAFDKSNSYIIGEDTLGFLAQKLVFDIKEITARKARIELQSLRDSMQNAFGVYWNFYKSAEASAIDFEHVMMQNFIQDVFVNGEVNPHGLNKWEEIVEDFLERTDEYATKPEECYRFVINKPFVKGYKMAKMVTGNLWEK
jgi:hypothetical protein